MNSWWSLVLLALAGFFTGGVYSFAKSRRWVLVAGLGVAAVLSLIGAVLWWDPA